ncbi:kelch-like protein 18 [Dendronephthya gigantea]|uniref:kelch-like protein 18 n=1 Tax=Dendronephthya gigantea TaxID=151771 RepID=UPI00106B07E1|nr:kelch-like protein 18 [Dendronephthya gigantea]
MLNPNLFILCVSCIYIEAINKTFQSDMFEIQHRLAKLKPLSDFQLSDSDHGSELLRRLNELRKTKSFCNVLLKTQEEHQGFAVHREVLVASSPYFKELCKDDSTTGQSQDIVVQNLTPSVLVAIIDYLYTGAIMLTFENAQDIFEAAALLQLKTLLTVSERYLMKCISPQNCLQVMSIATKWKFPVLLESARRCTSGNFAKVVELKEFPGIDAKNLKEVISSDHLIVGNENEVYGAVRKWIEHDREQRLKYVPLLMSQVRFRFMPQEFLTATYRQDPVMNVSPLSEDFVHEALMYNTLSPEERGKVHTVRVMERWCSLSIQVLLLIGGFSPEPEHNMKQWAFDPVNSQWYAISALQSPRHLFGMVHCDSGLYVFGGLKSMADDKFFATVEMYDAKLNRWKSVNKAMCEARCRFDAVSVGDVVYFVGGMCNDPHQKTLEMYYPNLAENEEENDRMEQVQTPSPKLPRYDHCSTVLDGKIYFIGGCTRGHRALRDVECYDPDQNIWSDVAPLLVPRTGACAVTLDERVIVIGGSNLKDPLSSCEMYDRSQNKWENIAPMNEFRDRCTAACFNNKIYVFGGSYGRVVQNSVECYNFKTNKWRVVSHLPEQKHGFKCVQSVINRSLVEQVGFEQV